MRNLVNWSLVIGGLVCIIAELLLGAVTGFDLALVGGSLAVGGAIGLTFESTRIGLFSAGALSLAYFLFFRKWMRQRLSDKGQPSNVDAIIGRSGVVTARIAPHQAGQVKIGDEIWRAELADSGAARDPGESITVDSVNGVTLKVR